MIFRWKPKQRHPPATEGFAGRVRKVSSWVEPAGRRWRWVVRLDTGPAATQDRSLMMCDGYERTKERAAMSAAASLARTLEVARQGGPSRLHARTVSITERSTT